jgi:predicted nucleic-acid-binding Zn-ribbon protein
VLHIHVEKIKPDHCLIAIATEFGEIKVFDVKNSKQKRSKYKKSEFTEFFSGNISSNICKIQLFVSEELKIPKRRCNS